MLKFIKSYQSFVLVLAFLCIASLSGALYFFIGHQSVDFSLLEYSGSCKPTIVLDDQGNELMRFARDKADSVDSFEIPSHIIQAFVAAEDHTFFKHNGISWRGIIRSLLVNCLNGRVVQGASTITQQIVKLLYTSSERSYIRKIKDQYLALLVEHSYTKEQILQAYLNNVCFGCGIYGIKAAARRFWQKEIGELTVPEAAALAGIVKSPTAYCPLTHPLSCERRRNLVLQSMHSLEFITSDECSCYTAQPLTLNTPEKNDEAWHAKEAIRIFLEDHFGKEALYQQGLLVKTTFNHELQCLAEHAFKAHVSELRNWLTKHLDGGLISLDTKAGAIKALIGGYDCNHSKFNRAFQAQRQIASSFKPIIFTAALLAGKTFADTEIDEPFELHSGNSVWRPNNHTMDFSGEMTLARALALSNNIITIKTMLTVGIEPVIALAKKFRISAELPPYPALALGCVDTTLKELAGMFNVFANNGIYVEPYFIEWVKNDVGQKIYRAPKVREQIIPARISGQVAKVLSLGLERAKAWYDDAWQCEAFGKTGTTNDSRTNCFVGATPEYTTAIYIGRDDNKAFGKVYGVTMAFPIWKNIFNKYPCKKKHFEYDPSLREITIDGKTGKQADSRAEGALTIFI